MAVERRRIAACGGGAPPVAERAVRPFDGDTFVILPALVNAHTHLELSWMRGRVPPSGRFDDWIRSLVALRRRESVSPTASALAAARDALREAHRSGTGLFGDISNTLSTVAVFRDAAVPAHVFLELLGFNTTDADHQMSEAREKLNAIPSTTELRITLAPHAPYTVSRALFSAIQRYLEEDPDAISTVHLGESAEEVEFLRSGTGSIRAALEELGAWNAEWIVPACRPVEYIAQVGLLQSRVLIIHAVQLTRAEIHLVKAAGATIVTCPRSNRWTGAGTPPISGFYASGVRVAIGTDSLASVEDLNMFSELAAVRVLARDVPAHAILQSATQTGAEALGFAGELGTIEPGKRADLVAVRVPHDVHDVEEYLLTGIPPADTRWLEPEP